MKCLSVLIVLAGIGLAACESAPVNFFVLNSLPEPAPVVGTEQARLAVESVQLAPYLDRKDIVSGRRGTRVDVAQLDQWAEPLDQGVARVLREDLGRLLAGQRIAVVPADFSNADFRLFVKVSRFDQDAETGEAVLNAQWQLMRADVDRELALQRSEHRQPVAGKDYDAITAAMNETLHALSRDIATATTRHMSSGTRSRAAR